MLLPPGGGGTAGAGRPELPAEPLGADDTPPLALEPLLVLPRLPPPLDAESRPSPLPLLFLLAAPPLVTSAHPTLPPAAARVAHTIQTCPRRIMTLPPKNPKGRGASAGPEKPKQLRTEAARADRDRDSSVAITSRFRAARPQHLEQPLHER
jgi:hypothetical protein